jgi:hypothetical protein
LKRVLLGALAALTGSACTQTFKSDYKPPTCREGEVLAGQGPDKPVTCISPSTFSVPSAPSAAHALITDAATHAQKVDAADSADVARFGPSGPWVIGSETPNGAQVGLAVPEGGLLIDGRHTSFRLPPTLQTNKAVGLGGNQTILKTDIVVPMTAWYRLEASGTVGADGNLSDGSHGTCQIQFELNNAVPSKTVSSYGSPTFWNVVQEVVLEPGTYTAMVSLVGDGCEEDPAGGTYSTQPAVLTVEVFHAS